MVSSATGEGLRMWFSSTCAMGATYLRPGCLAGSGQPDVSHLAGTSELERYASAVWLLERPKSPEGVRPAPHPGVEAQVSAIDSGGYGISAGNSAGSSAEHGQSRAPRFRPRRR
jgi:hypothetical protein